MESTLTYELFNTYKLSFLIIKLPNYLQKEFRKLITKESLGYSYTELFVCAEKSI